MFDLLLPVVYNLFIILTSCLRDAYLPFVAFQLAICVFLLYPRMLEPGKYVHHHIILFVNASFCKSVSGCCYLFSFSVPAIEIWYCYFSKVWCMCFGFGAVICLPCFSHHHHIVVVLVYCTICIIPGNSICMLRRTTIFLTKLCHSKASIIVLYKCWYFLFLTTLWHIIYQLGFVSSFLYDM